MASAILLIGILAIGIIPRWLNDLIRPASEIIMNKIGAK
jgi:NADH:ubiquinone oxidoreductase subunit 4 (subunit M)